jgi:hypothetical protein
MSWLRDFFKPRQDNFTKLLIEQAACVVKGLEALNAYVTAAEVAPGEVESDARPADSKTGEVKSGGKTADGKGGDGKSSGRSRNFRAVDAVRQCEEDADEVRRILIDELNRTFVTPFDREDISALSRAIDDIMDYAWSTVQEMELLHVSPTPHLQRMVSLLHEAAREVHMAMLRIKDHPGVAAEHAQRAKALENRVEHVYREALADLFEGPAGPKRVIVILKMREVYRHLSNAADRGDAAANIISDIVVKMT